MRTKHSTFATDSTSAFPKTRHECDNQKLLRECLVPSQSACERCKSFAPDLAGLEFRLAVFEANLTRRKLYKGLENDQPRGEKAIRKPGK